MPKQRYSIMREYLPTQGKRGRDMMQRTSTVQANFDYSSEEDAMRKLAVITKLAPVFEAITANAPFAGTIHKCEIFVFASRSTSTQSKTTHLPSGEGTGAPTRLSFIMSSNVNGRFAVGDGV